MTFKNLFLPLLGMLVVYHCAEMESPFKDVTASCLLKHKVDDRLKGFSASRAVTESLVQPKQLCSLHVLHRAKAALGWLGQGTWGVLGQS